MRKLIAIITLLIAATSATAQTPSCDILAAMAGMTMVARQNGVTATKQIEITNQHITDPMENKRATAIIIQAYELPMMNVARNKQVMINEFQSQIFVACLKGRI